jgi:hypothetical protein
MWKIERLDAPQSLLVDLTVMDIQAPPSGGPKPKAPAHNIFGDDRRWHPPEGNDERERAF